MAHGLGKAAVFVIMASAVAFGVHAGQGDEPRFEAAHAEFGAEFLQTVERIEAGRKALGERWRAADRDGKRAVREEARAYVVRALTEEIFPAWMGVPWTMAVIRDGLKPNARVPWEKGRGVSCSWFVVSTLRNAGLRFSSPSAFAGTIAVHLEHSVAPGQIVRKWDITPKELEEKLVAKGPGLWVIGLNCHIGFVHVTEERAFFIHSSYVEPYAVVREPLATSEAIALSEEAGYVLAPLFRDDRLIDHWLQAGAVPFEKLPGRRKR